MLMVVSKPFYLSKEKKMQRPSVWNFTLQPHPHATPHLFFSMIRLTSQKNHMKIYVMKICTSY